MYYLNCFLFYSIFGFFLETGIAKIFKTNFESGILFGPWTPIYGIGVTFILILSNYFFFNLHMSRWIETIVVFLIVSIFLSCLELIGGILIENTFHVVFWDYTSQKYHIGRYISLEMTIVWGFATIIFIYIVNPAFKSIIKKIPSCLSIFILVAMIIDYVFTLYIKLKK